MEEGKEKNEIDVRIPMNRFPEELDYPRDTGVNQTQ